MGLDMYLFKKSKTSCDKGATGACGGLFPLAPKSDGMEEIGYWRKHYTLMDFICNLLNVEYGEINCEKLEMTLQQIEKVISECKFREEEDYYEDDYDKSWWEATLPIFEKAKSAIEDEDAHIYFECWY